MTPISEAEGRARAVNIVLVEDDEIDVMNVKRAFGRANITSPLFIAGDGVEGLALLRGNAVPTQRRIVLLDLNMPRMNGIEMLRELRADPTLRKTPVIVLTTSNHDRDRIEAYDLSVAGYLLKPVTFASFVEMMTVLSRYWNLVELP